jgi:hypothetical protein
MSTKTKTDYIPRSDAAFDRWQQNLISYAAPRAGQWNIPGTVFPRLTVLQTEWSGAYAAASVPESRTKATVQAKNTVRTVFKGQIRVDVKAYIMYNPEVTDADRDNMGLPIHDTKPSIIPPPVGQPMLEVDFSKHQQHGIIVKPPAGQSKPAGAHGFEVYKKAGGDAPVKDEDFTYAGFSTRSPFVIAYKLEDRGQTVYYRARWVNAKNEPGDWSDIVSAIVP